MTQEQKAKAYDEAIDKVAHFIKKHIGFGCMIHPNSSEAKELFNIFPELKESEDERIRKEMIFYFQEEIPQCSIQEHSDKMREFISWLKRQEIECIKLELKAGNSYFCYKSRWERADNETFKKGLIYKCNKDGVLDNFVIKNPEQHFIEIKDERIAWLEKQGEQKYKFRIGDTIKEKSTGDIVTICEIDLKNREYRLTNTGFIPFKYEYLWELVEQKPTDKVEPKFHEGDWVVDKNGTVRQILSYKDGIYKHTDGYSATIFEDEWRMWDIAKDAKDGDVLQLGKVTAIFKEFIGNECCRCYCSVCNGEFEIPSQDGADNSYGCHNAIPATKEQRDLLFQKMKENGYEWDAEKKELKEIIDEKQIKKNLQDNRFRRMFEQKSVWS